MTVAGGLWPMLESRLALALLVLRVTLGLFLLQWGIEKFVVPGTTLAIFRNFYGFDPGALAPPVLGALQVVLALAFLLGVRPRITYGVALLLHSVTTLVTIPRLLAPWNPVSNHLFIAGVPVLAAFFALYLLRDADRYRLGGVRV
jgi:putative oxidoreductase